MQHQTTKRSPSTIIQSYEDAAEEQATSNSKGIIRSVRAQWPPRPSEQELSPSSLRKRASSWQTSNALPSPARGKSVLHRHQSVSRSSAAAQTSTTPTNPTARIQFSNDRAELLPRPQQSSTRTAHPPIKFLLHSLPRSPPRLPVPARPAIHPRQFPIRPSPTNHRPQSTAQHRSCVKAKAPSPAPDPQMPRAFPSLRPDLGPELDPPSNYGSLLSSRCPAPSRPVPEPEPEPEPLRGNQFSSLFLSLAGSLRSPTDTQASGARRAGDRHGG